MVTGPFGSTETETADGIGWPDGGVEERPQLSISRSALAIKKTSALPTDHLMLLAKNPKTPTSGFSVEKSE
jgi:hypothetical protein